MRFDNAYALVNMCNRVIYIALVRLVDVYSLSDALLLGDSALA